ncbi:transposase-like zinc-binding domain-containing protein [Stygiolobus caldivivus]|uniref:IS1/IS1595 family N-terminal zinc-binding domain-containing protein n=1 Tax=Stygiolobus caldivivus TaxID=2824673 RepID=UPI003B845A3A
MKYDVACPSYSSHHVVKSGKPLDRQKYLCRDCDKNFPANLIITITLGHVQNNALSVSILLNYSSYSTFNLT